MQYTNRCAAFHPTLTRVSCDPIVDLFIITGTVPQRLLPVRKATGLALTFIFDEAIWMDRQRPDSLAICQPKPDARTLGSPRRILRGHGDTHMTTTAQHDGLRTSKNGGRRNHHFPQLLSTNWRLIYNHVIPRRTGIPVHVHFSRTDPHSEEELLSGVNQGNTVHSPTFENVDLRLERPVQFLH